VRLRWLEVRDVRCYPAVRFEPEPGLNVLVGRNGAGKTSLLEAVGYLGILKSFRGTPDEAIVRDGADAAVIRGEFDGTTGTVRVEVEVPAAGRRRILFNGKRPHRNRDVLAEVPIVTFQPDDLDLVKRGPALRRAYLDDLAAQLWPQAVADQQEFERALRQRNMLLRREGRSADPMTLDVWDLRLSESGAKVLAHRRRVLADLDPHLAEAYRLVGARSNLTWRYGTNWGGAEADGVAAIQEALQGALGARRERDLDQRVTSVGPHRDDPLLFVDGRLARNRASQGEQRTIALALRIGAYRILTHHHGTVPILLLDDVFSELDPVRSRGVLELLGGGQVLVTSARDDEVPAEGRRWEVAKGAVT
jgi:DNA replication and repair protein RecF